MNSGPAFLTPATTGIFGFAGTAHHAVAAVARALAGELFFGRATSRRAPGFNWGRSAEAGRTGKETQRRARIQPALPKPAPPRARSRRIKPNSTGLSDRAATPACQAAVSGLLLPAWLKGQQAGPGQPPLHPGLQAPARRPPQGCAAIAAPWSSWKPPRHGRIQQIAAGDQAHDAARSAQAEGSASSLSSPANQRRRAIQQKAAEANRGEACNCWPGSGPGSP